MEWKTIHAQTGQHRAQYLCGVLGQSNLQVVDDIPNGGASSFLKQCLSRVDVVTYNKL